MSEATDKKDPKNNAADEAASHAEKAKTETKAAAEETAKVVVAKAMTNRGKIGFLTGVLLTMAVVAVRAKKEAMSDYSNQDNQ